MSAKPTPPLCKDCAHFTAEQQCSRKPAMRNTVTGEQFYPLCETERSSSFRDRFLTATNRCGPQGRFFLARSGGVEFRWETPSGCDQD